MRFQNVALVMLFAVGVSAPARAQVVTAATIETVEARLMSFDRNNDGLIARNELPERMQDLLARGDRSQDGILDRVEVRQLAVAPVRQVLLPGGLQVGSYGFGGESFFDSKLHIEGALDDLRLAGDTRQKALDVVRAFLANADAKAENDLLATMTQLLTVEQLDDFKASLSAQTHTVPAIQRGGVTIFGANAEEAAGQPVVMTRLRLVSRSDVEPLVAGYALDPEAKRLALQAVRQFKAHVPGRVNDAERAALVEQLRSLLNDVQRDDLRAALERRPVQKLGNVTVRIVSSTLSDAGIVQPVTTFTMQDLVLKR